jgi:hypothetical protein
MIRVIGALMVCLAILLLSVTYDSADRRKTMTVSGRSAVKYTFDDANRLDLIPSFGKKLVMILYQSVPLPMFGAWPCVPKIIFCRTRELSGNNKHGALWFLITLRSLRLLVSL